MSELMHGIYSCVDPGLFKKALYRYLDHVIGYPRSALGNEQGLFSRRLDLQSRSLVHPVIYSFKTGVVKIDRTLFITFTDYG